MTDIRFLIAHVWSMLTGLPINCDRCHALADDTPEGDTP